MKPESLNIVYTKHALEKLTRSDYRKFKVTKFLIRKALKLQQYPSQTKTGENSVLLPLNGYTLRVVYVKMETEKKVITFHIAKRGRYEI